MGLDEMRTKLHGSESELAAVRIQLEEFIADKQKVSLIIVCCFYNQNTERQML